MKPSITVTKTITEQIEVDQLANWFWMLDADQKIEFFNSLARQTDEWFGGLKYCDETISEFIDSPRLTKDARHILDLLSNPSL